MLIELKKKDIKEIEIKIEIKELNGKLIENFFLIINNLKFNN